MTTINAVSFYIENLDLTAGGFPGLAYTGTLQIEPDDSLSNEDWYVYEAWTEAGFTYGRKSQPEIFAAICKAVANDRDVHCEIWDMVTE